MWGNSTNINRAFILQKKCIRSICGVGQLESCRPLFKKLNVLALPSLYIFEVLVFAKKNTDLFTKKREQCNFRTRYPSKLIIPPSATTCFTRNSYSMCIKLYNLLPEPIQNLLFAKYKRIIFRILVENCFYDTDEFIRFCRDGHIRKIANEF